MRAGAEQGYVFGFAQDARLLLLCMGRNQSRGCILGDIPRYMEESEDRLDGVGLPLSRGARIAPTVQFCQVGIKILQANLIQAGSPVLLEEVDQVCQVSAVVDACLGGEVAREHVDHFVEFQGVPQRLGG